MSFSSSLGLTTFPQLGLPQKVFLRVTGGKKGSGGAYTLTVLFSDPVTASSASRMIARPTRMQFSWLNRGRDSSHIPDAARHRAEARVAADRLSGHRLRGLRSPRRGA
jgi:hypothetical protein